MRGTRDRGEGVVGYVILVPVALFVVLLAVQAAVYFHEANIADNAAGRAAATASRRGSGSRRGDGLRSHREADGRTEFFGRT